MALSTRNATRIACNKEIGGVLKAQNDAKVISGKIVTDNASKRMAEASPEGGPDHKRSVFGDLTNAITVDALMGKKEEKRVTRSQSFNSLKVSQEQRKSKRLSGKSAEISIDKSGNSESMHSDSSDSFESAEESLNSTAKISSPSESRESIDDSENVPASICVKRSQVPEGVVDFDAETSEDLFSSPLYVQDIFRYFTEREKKFIVPKYMERQREISKHMRAVLVDWMAEVQESFELNHETLYLAVKLVDLYLSRERVPKTVLQLIGSTALLIASKYDERSPPAVDDFLYICDDAYDRRQLLRMEIRMLKVVNFDLGAPLSYTFLRRYARCSKQSLELLTLARYILEVSLLDYEVVDMPDSLLAAAALSLALKMSKLEEWNVTLEYYSGYKITDLTELIHRLNYGVTNVRQKNLLTIPTKYSHKVFFSVAKLPPLDHCAI